MAGPPEPPGMRPGALPSPSRRVARPCLTRTAPRPGRVRRMPMSGSASPGVPLCFARARILRAGLPLLICEETRGTPPGGPRGREWAGRRRRARPAGVRPGNWGGLPLPPRDCRLEPQEKVPAADPREARVPSPLPRFSGRYPWGCKPNPPQRGSHTLASCH